MVTGAVALLAIMESYDRELCRLLRTPRGERLQLQAYLPLAARTLDSSACMDRGASFLPKLLELIA